jgi:CRISPR-associated endonuclease Cas1
VPRYGVVTLFGYGISACVDRNHLVLQDGVGPKRRFARLPRVNHGLKRLVVIGADGMVSFSALRWLADQEAAFILLNRNGTVLAVTGPVGPSDARLRRSQSLAHQSGAALRISRELISRKLDGQERVIRDHFRESAVCQTISSMRESLSAAKTIQAIRLLESQAAQAYWSAWRNLPINFPTADLRSVPEHWRVFGTRKSPLTRSPRLAVNPACAMLNYMYALVESEARLAAAALGLDPGIGFLHVDTDARDSLACDLMETVRPRVDAFLLQWITSEPLRREWFFEQRDGNCRLMASFAERLSGTMPAWSQYLGPIAEWVSRVLWSTFRNHGRKPATDLTQNHRRYAKGTPLLRVSELPQIPRLCRSCGRKLSRGRQLCSNCNVEVTTQAMIKAAEKGRLLAHTPEAEAKRAANQRRNIEAQKAWRPTDLPIWLDQDTYKTRILPRLADVKVSAIRLLTGVSKPYATAIRSGERLPHPRHWQALAKLLEMTSDC